VDGSPQIGSHQIHVTHEQAAFVEKQSKKMRHGAKKYEGGLSERRVATVRHNIPLEPPRMARVFGEHTPVDMRCSATAMKSS
jgi:hypothetical protein